MDFVFISHSNADKPRIKLITDKLIEVGLTLWVDRPEEMGYTAPEIKRSFLRIRPGKPWKDEIDEAALSAGCLLLFASYRVLEEGRHHWHDEIRFGHARKTILAARLDAVDLSKIPIAGRDVSQLQKMDVLLPPDATSSNITGERRNAIDVLVDAVVEKLESQRAATFGTFSPTKSKVSGPSAEQVQNLMTLLAREVEATEIANAGAVSLLCAHRPARADYLIQRMPKLELPCRAAIQAKTGAERRNLQALRADIIRGALNVPNGRWVPDLVPWTASADRGGASAANAFLNAALERLGFAAHTPPQSPRELHQLLDDVDDRVFLFTSFLDISPARKNNEQLVRFIATWFASAPADRLRVLIHVQPEASWLNWLRRTDVWLHQASKDCKLLDLNDVARTDLMAWEEITGHLFSTDKSGIGSTIDSAFGPKLDRTRRSIEELESNLKPSVAAWRLKQISSKQMFTPRVLQEWQDNDVQAI
jgi:hypothetical protein